MPFTVVSGVGRGMGVLDGGGDLRRKGAVWGESVASHFNECGRRRTLSKLLRRGHVQLIIDVVCGGVLDNSSRERRSSDGRQLEVRAATSITESPGDVVFDHELVVPLVYRRSDVLQTPLTTTRTRRVSIYSAGI